eukprot:6193631-Pleurochrysis_carterae.AAC.3
MAKHAVTRWAPGVGEWGGACTCPDGQVLYAGDNSDHCGSLACLGGVSGTCQRYKGPWSWIRVECTVQTGWAGPSGKSDGACRGSGGSEGVLQTY